MDPDQALSQIETNRISDPRLAARIANDLSLWLSRGQGRPNWYTYPEAAKFYQNNSMRTSMHAWSRLYVSSVTAWGLLTNLNSSSPKAPDLISAGRLVGNWSQDFLTLSLQLLSGPLKEQALSPTYSVQIGLICDIETDLLFGQAFTNIIKQTNIKDKPTFKSRSQVRKWLTSNGYQVVKVLE